MKHMISSDLLYTEITVLLLVTACSLATFVFVDVAQEKTVHHSHKHVIIYCSNTKSSTSLPFIATTCLTKKNHVGYAH